MVDIYLLCGERVLAAWRFLHTPGAVGRCFRGLILLPVDFLWRMDPFSIGSICLAFFNLRCAYRNSWACPHKQGQSGFFTYRDLPLGISWLCLCKQERLGFAHSQTHTLEIPRGTSFQTEKAGQVLLGLEGPSPVWEFLGCIVAGPSSPRRTHFLLCHSINGEENGWYVSPNEEDQLCWHCVWAGLVQII